jgi:hypothetical protein
MAALKPSSVDFDTSTDLAGRLTLGFDHLSRVVGSGCPLLRGPCEIRRGQLDRAVPDRSKRGAGGGRQGVPGLRISCYTVGTNKGKVSR